MPVQQIFAKCRLLLRFILLVALLSVTLVRPQQVKDDARPRLTHRQRYLQLNGLTKLNASSVKHILNAKGSKGERRRRFNGHSKILEDRLKAIVERRRNRDRKRIERVQDVRLGARFSFAALGRSGSSKTGFRGISRRRPLLHSRIPPLSHKEKMNRIRLETDRTQANRERHKSVTVGPLTRKKVEEKEALSPNQKLELCCRKQAVQASCQELCHFDRFTKERVIGTFLANKCPGEQLSRAFDCATSKADHTECCLAAQVHLHNNGKCMTFCQPEDGVPGSPFQYISCLPVFEKIKDCYQLRQKTHPNIFGD